MHNIAYCARQIVTRTSENVSVSALRYVLAKNNLSVLPSLKHRLGKTRCKWSIFVPGRLPTWALCGTCSPINNWITKDCSKREESLTIFKIQSTIHIYRSLDFINLYTQTTAVSRRKAFIFCNYLINSFEPDVPCILLIKKQHLLLNHLLRFCILASLIIINLLLL